MKFLFFLSTAISTILFGTQWKYVPNQASVKFAVYTDKKEIEAEGVLTGLQGYVCVNDVTNEPDTITAIIDVKTINSGISLRDESLRSSDFFDATKYPTIIFKSEKINKVNDSFMAKGFLQIKNIKKEVSILFTIQTLSTTEKCLIGNFIIDRMQYGVGTTGDGIGNKVKIDLIVPIRK
jgi:polyisoprenoid-binding protein YceI